MRVIIVKKQTLILAVLIALAVIAGIVILCTMGAERPSAPAMQRQQIEEYELNVLAGKRRELPIYAVERTDKAIALTIDAAWEDDKTAFILDTLKQHDIPATFFLCGVWVEAYPDQVKAIASAGHEIGNHSLTHPHMNKLDAAAVQKEISDLDDQIEALTGKRCTLFRAPYGEYNDTVIKAVRDFGYEPVQWNLDTIDWKQERSAEVILNTVVPKLSPGSIILCHNNGYRIKDYLPVLIEKATEQGYTFVTMSGLLLAGETVIDQNGVQKPSAAQTPAAGKTPAATPIATPAPKDA